MVVPPWFLYVAGFSLLVLGLLQLGARPVREGAGLTERYLNVGTFWSLLCIVVGALVVAMALGYVTPDWAAAPRPPRPKARLR